MSSEAMEVVAKAETEVARYRLADGRSYFSEDIRKHLNGLKPEDLEGLAKEIENDSIRKRSLEQLKRTWPHRKLVLQRSELSSEQLKQLLKFTECFGLHLRIESGCDSLLIEINDFMF